MDFFWERRRTKVVFRNLPKKLQPTVLTKSENYPTLEYNMLSSIPYKKLFTLDGLGHGL
jgi:hypothetical protein